MSYRNFLLTQAILRCGICLLIVILGGTERMHLK